jgi:hypothetical protein
LQLACGLAVLALILMAASASSADETWAMLEGRWSGVGTIELDGGGQERLKCQAVYRNEADGHVAQRLTCIGASYRIDGGADLIFEGNRLTGTWTEQSYSVGGGLAGSARNGIMAFKIDGPTFSGTVSIEVQRCRQSIAISLSNTIIERIVAGLRRC